MPEGLVRVLVFYLAQFPQLRFLDRREQFGLSVSRRCSKR